MGIYFWLAVTLFTTTVSVQVYIALLAYGGILLCF